MAEIQIAIEGAGAEAAAAELFGLEGLEGRYQISEEVRVIVSFPVDVGVAIIVVRGLKFLKDDNLHVVKNHCRKNCLRLQIDQNQIQNFFIYEFTF